MSTRTGRTEVVAAALRRGTTAPMAGDSIALVATSGLTALTGIAFWALAARLIPPHQLGIETALLSLITTAGTVCASGTGNAFTAMLPATSVWARADQIRHGLSVAAGMAAFGGTLAALVGIVIITDESPYLIFPLIVLGSIAMAAFSVKDAIVTGLSATRQLPVQNFIASLAKMAALPLCALAVPLPAVSATLIPSAIAVIIVCGLVIPAIVKKPPTGPRHEARPVFARREILAFSLRDGGASFVSLGLLLSAPFLTTWLAGPVAGAALGLMLPMSQGLDFVTIGIATALTKHLAADLSQAVSVLRVWLAALIIVGVGAVTLILAVGPLLIMLIGPRYDPHLLWWTLTILVLGAISRVSYVMWAALQRARRRTSTLLRTNSVVFVLVAPLLVVCIINWGAIGAATGLAGGSMLLGAVGAAALLRESRRMRSLPTGGRSAS